MQKDSQVSITQACVKTGGETLSLLPFSTYLVAEKRGNFRVLDFQGPQKNTNRKFFTIFFLSLLPTDTYVALIKIR